jgi:hypothetical protein
MGCGVGTASSSLCQKLPRCIGNTLRYLSALCAFCKEERGQSTAARGGGDGYVYAQLLCEGKGGNASLHAASDLCSGRNAGDDWGSGSN